MAVFNWTINPYGQYSPDLIRPLVHDTRAEKYAMFDALQEQPDGLILGSSRAMKFEPQYLHDRTSLKFFNFAVNHGRPEDFLAILRAYRDRYGCSPKVVLLAVDIAALNDTVPSDARLCAEPNLYRFVQNELPWRESFDRFCQLFSYQQTSSSLSAIQMAWQRRAPQNDEQFDPDGVIQYRRRKSEQERGTYDFAEALEFNRKEYQSLYGAMKNLSQTRLAYLFETVRLCEHNGCRVFLFTTVHHPKLQAALIDKTNFKKLESEALVTLARLAADLHADFLDFGSLDTFSGSEHEFYDGIHPTEFNTRLMIDRMLPKLNEALYAIY